MSNLLAKQDLTGKQLSMVQSEMENKKKSKKLAYVFWWFLGVLGGHRFYSGDTGIGLGMLFTLGGFGIWTLIDVFLIGQRIEKVNEGIEREIIEEVKIYGNSSEKGE